MSNKFRQIIDAKRKDQAEEGTTPPEADAVPAHLEPETPAVVAPASPPQPASTNTRRGRPPKPEGAKRTNPDFEQVTAYIRRQTYKRVKIQLIEEDREFSDLVEELLTIWLKRTA